MPILQREMWRGDAPTYDLAVKKRDGTAQPTTGWKLWMTAKRAVGDTDAAAVFQLTTDALGGIVAIDATKGLYEVTVPAAATTGFPDRDVVLEYDIQAKDAAGNTTTIERGQLRVKPDITRATT